MINSNGAHPAVALVIGGMVNHTELANHELTNVLDSQRGYEGRIRSATRISNHHSSSLPVQPNDLAAKHFLADKMLVDIIARIPSEGAETLIGGL